MIEPAATERRDEPVEDRPRAVLGVIVAPGLAHDVTSRIASELLQDLRERYDSVDWDAELDVDRLVDPPAPLTEIFAAGRRKLLEGDWDLGVVVTDLPLKVGGRPVSRHLSPTHGLAVLSLPALGALHLRQRLRRALVELIGELTGRGGRRRVGGERAAGARDRHRPTARASSTYPSWSRATCGCCSGWFARTGRGVSRPGSTAPWWRRSPSARTGSSASTSGVSPAPLGWWRLAAHVPRLDRRRRRPAVIVRARPLGARARPARARPGRPLQRHDGADRAIGIALLYVALFLLIFGAAELLVRPGLFAPGLGHSAGIGDYAALAWFTASFATVAGGLGAGLESQEAVREAAYATAVREEEAA